MALNASSLFSRAVAAAMSGAISAACFAMSAGLHETTAESTDACTRRWCGGTRPFLENNSLRDRRSRFVAAGSEDCLARAWKMAQEFSREPSNFNKSIRLEMTLSQSLSTRRNDRSNCNAEKASAMAGAINAGVRSRPRAIRGKTEPA